MADRTRIRLQKNEQATEVLALVAHPMSGSERPHDEKVKTEEPNFIERMDFLINGNSVAKVFLSPHIAWNPLMTISVDGVSTGDKVTVRWHDNQGRNGKAETINQ